MVQIQQQVQLERLHQLCANVQQRCKAQKKAIALTLETLALQREKYSSCLSQYSDTTPVMRFEALLDYLWQSHGFDFTGYKRSSLMRQVQHRMQMLEIESVSNYIDYLQLHPEEFVHLFNTILIDFTSFFRDASTWDYLTTQIVPRLVAAKSESEPIRVWSAGCASGQEAYTLAIVLAEALGVDRFRDRVQIYGTDVNTEALNQARSGSYLSSQVVGIPTTLLDRYFKRSEERYVFRQDLRRSIIFCRHNLIQDPPISKIDLLVCRNVLIYFNTETQIRALARFHSGLKDSGFLLLGSAETVPTCTNLFTSVDIWHHVFTKVPRGDSNKLLLPRL